MSNVAVVPIPLIALAAATAIAVGLIVLVARRVAWPWRILKGSSMPLATLEERQKTRERIETKYRRLRDPHGAPVDVLFAEAKAAYDAGRDRLKQLDAKAGTLIGIVTTGFGAIALLGDPSKMPKNGVWLSLGLVALAIAFAFALFSLVPRTSEFPSLSDYVLPSTVANPSNAPRIKLDLTEAWLRAGNQDDRAAFAKARLLILATAALGIGLGALAANYSIGKDGQKPVPTIRVIQVPDASPAP